MSKPATHHADGSEIFRPRTPEEIAAITDPVKEALRAVFKQRWRYTQVSESLLDELAAAANGAVTARMLQIVSPLKNIKRG